MKHTWIVFSLFLMVLSGCANTVQKVEVRKTASGYQLFRGGKPYYIKGAGILDHYKMLSDYGGNSVRTWGITEWDKVFSLAEKHGLTVCAGIWLEQERQGFDYSDTAAVRIQFEEIKEAILKYKDHPSLLIWGIGNELDITSGTHGYQYGGFWPATISRYLSAIGCRHPHRVTMNVDRVLVHAQIGQSDPYAISGLNDEVVYCWEYLAVKGK